MAKNTFGQRLRQARTDAGLSQSDLERASGIPKTTLSRYENDHILPSIHSLQMLADALGVQEGALIAEGAARVREHFFSMLEERGIRITTLHQAEEVADAVADVLDGREAPEA